MSLPPILQGLPLPVIGSPMFIVSGPELVIAQCKAGIVGTFPALNARPSGTLEKWIVRIKLELDEYQKANPDKIVAPSLQANQMVYDATHSYGGIILHDVTNIRHSKKALSMGADGLIAVCSGAGGHAGRLSPFALIPEIRQFFDGPLLLSGSIATGGAIAASLAMGADMAYIGTRFIATAEANAEDGYKNEIVESSGEDIIYSSLFTGVHGNYLRGSIEKAGLDPDNLPEADKSTMNFGSGGNTDAKAWKDIWGAGQGVGSVHTAPPVADVIAELQSEFDKACEKLAAKLS